MRTITHHQVMPSESLSSILLPTTFFLILLLSVMLYGLEYPFGQLGSAVLAVLHWLLVQPKPAH